MIALFSPKSNGIIKITICDSYLRSVVRILIVYVFPRYENPTNAGVSHMLEMVSFRSTAHLSHLRTTKTLEALGAEAKCDANREYIGYYANCLREYFPLVAPIMVGNVLYPRLLRWEVASAESKVLEKNFIF